jgi:hypothetical protein
VSPCQDTPWLAASGISHQALTRESLHVEGEPAMRRPNSRAFRTLRLRIETIPERTLN